jgi:tRNA A37 methylthiotransferase MiaB
MNYKEKKYFVLPSACTNFALRFDNKMDGIVNKTVACFTLGCKLNFAETSTIGNELALLGIKKARQGEQADFCIINSCSVTELADKKSRQMIRRIRKLHPDAFLIVTGCYAQLKPEDVAQIEGVDLVLGIAQKKDIAKYILSHLVIDRRPLQLQTADNDAFTSLRGTKQSRLVIGRHEAESR